MPIWGPLLAGLGAGVGSSLLGGLFGGGDDDQGQLNSPYADIISQIAQAQWQGVEPLFQNITQRAGGFLNIPGMGINPQTGQPAQPLQPQQSLQAPGQQPIAGGNIAQELMGAGFMEEVGDEATLKNTFDPYSQSDWEQLSAASPDLARRVAEQFGSVQRGQNVERFGGAVGDIEQKISAFGPQDTLGTAGGGDVTDLTQGPDGTFGAAPSPGGFDVTQSPLWQPSRNILESQFGVARENIISSLPRGGGLQSALGELEGTRATGLTDLAGGIAADEYQQILNLITGSTGQAMSGLGGLASASAGLQGQQFAAEQQGMNDLGMAIGLAMAGGNLFGGGGSGGGGIPGLPLFQ